MIKDLNFSLGNEVDELLAKKEYEKAYNTLCSNYPDVVVARLKRGEYSENDSSIIPSWIALVISLGVDYITPSAKGYSEFDKFKMKIRNNDVDYNNYLKECQLRTK